ncbi:hypothetical protein PENTCL1PPCAC_6703, partial [Pristionchus entomophagus]
SVRSLHTRHTRQRERGHTILYPSPISSIIHPRERSLSTIIGIVDIWDVRSSSSGTFRRVHGCVGRLRRWSSGKATPFTVPIVFPTGLQ